MSVVYWCYLCHRCGEFHPIGVECARQASKRMQGAYMMINEYKDTIDRQSKELRELLEMKRYMVNHKEWEQYYK